MNQQELIFVHPKALVETEDIGSGTRIWAFAHIMKGAFVGVECNIGGHVFVESGAHIGNRVTVKNNVLVWQAIHIEDDVFVGPGVVFTNDRYPRSARMANVPEVTHRYAIEERWLLSTRICCGSSLGAGAIIMPDLTIGAYATVAAGAVVTKSVAPHQLVVGNPGKPNGWVCFCGIRLDQSKERAWVCGDCNKKFQHTDQGLVLGDESV